MKPRPTRYCKECRKPMINPRPNKESCNPKCKAVYWNKIYRTDGRIPQLKGDYDE